jgi:hypothetical protein
MIRCIRTAPLLLLALLAASCRQAEPLPAPAPLPDAQAATTAAPQDAFFAQLTSLCGRAFRGEALLVSGPGFEGEMIMHVRRCSENEIQIPLHIGENRSRTWIITRTAQGLRLKHDHRIEDGTDDPVTQYGGDTAEPGTATRQSFPADAFTARLIPEAATNVWTITLTPGQRLHYHLTRHGQPRATFQFDLTDEVPPPPAPWGYEGT